jgi:hypothetical protein
VSKKKLVAFLAIIIGSFILVVFDIDARHLRGGAVVIEVLLWILFAGVVAECFDAPLSKNSGKNKKEKSI